jgi:TolB-like protein
MGGSEKYRLKLIGPFGLFAPGGERIEISSKKAVALVALLASAPDGVRTRVWLQSVLWGTRDTAQAQSSLRRELSTLQKLFEAHGAGDILERETQRIGLKLDHIDIDMLALDLADGRSAPSRDDFLEGIDLKGCEDFEDWLRDQRARLADLRSVAIPVAHAPLPTAQQVLGGPLPPQSELLSTNPPRPPPKPSVAVLPFTHLGRSEQANWLGAGIAQEVGMTLAQFPQLFVVSATSAAVLAGRRLTHTEIAHQLGVRYLLDGTLLESAGRLRATISLLDGKTGLQVWGCSVDGRRDDIFSLQEAVATKTAPQIWTQIDLAERHRSLRQAPRSGDNYELYWRANALFRSWDRASTLEAIRLTDELTASDPACPLSAGLAAFCNSVAFAFRWTADPQATRRAAIAHYQNALRLGQSNVESLGYVAGTLIGIGGDLDLADQIISHALSLLPAYQPTLFWGGWVDVARGEPARGRERLELALRINPASGVRAYALTGIGIANLFLGEDAAAFAMLTEAAFHLPTYPIAVAGLCVAAARTGNRVVAHRAAASLLELGEVGKMLEVLQRPAHRDGLAAAIADIVREMPARSRESHAAVNDH